MEVLNHMTNHTISQFDSTGASEAYNDYSEIAVLVWWQQDVHHIGLLHIACWPGNCHMTSHIARLRRSSHHHNALHTDAVRTPTRSCPVVACSIVDPGGVQPRGRRCNNCHSRWSDSCILADVLVALCGTCDAQTPPARFMLIGGPASCTTIALAPQRAFDYMGFYTCLMVFLNERNYNTSISVGRPVDQSRVYHHTKLPIISNDNADTCADELLPNHCTFNATHSIHITREFLAQLSSNKVKHIMNPP